MTLELVTIPCLSDNYAFLARCEKTGTVALADAPEAAPIAAELKARGWGLDLILITHHHGDHIDGVEALRAEFGAKTVGHKADAKRLPALDIEVSEGDTVAIGASEGIVLEVSGHTIGHIAYHFPEAEIAFTGDSLMALGCGRVFEGTKPQMWASLSKFLNLPGETLICSGHEYTSANAKFALSVDPENPALIQRTAAISAARAKGQPTVPSKLSDEFATNPFLRAAQADLKAAMGMENASDEDVFTEIRTRKDSF